MSRIEPRYLLKRARAAERLRQLHAEKSEILSVFPELRCRLRTDRLSERRILIPRYPLTTH